MELLDQAVDFTAIFAYNNAMAEGCLSALRERKIQVPNDVSVLGFDDVLLARYMNPGLSTVRYPVEAMGAGAAELALSLGDDIETGTGIMEFSPDIILRESVRSR